LRFTHVHYFVYVGECVFVCVCLYVTDNGHLSWSPARNFQFELFGFIKF